MAKKTQNTGLSAGAKVAVLAVVFGIPCLFAFSSWGLERVYEIAPWAIVALLVLVATAYTAYTSGLMYTFYQVNAPLTRFIPCVCEVSLIDIKYHTPCYICYVAALICFGASQLPYSIIGILGQTFATTAPFYLLILSLLFLFVVQIIKGLGLIGCIKDVGAEWHKQTHADLGAITKFSYFSFVPFVRILTIYTLNKPLSTLVSFRGATVADSVQDRGFAEEEEDEDED